MAHPEVCMGVLKETVESRWEEYENEYEDQEGDYEAPEWRCCGGGRQGGNAEYGVVVGVGCVVDRIA